MKSMTLDAFCRHLATRPAAVRQAQHQGVRAGAERVAAEARSLIGTYQPAVGPFPAWAQLADSTQRDRVAQSFAANDPLERTGELRDSIEASAAGNDGAAGSNHPVAAYQELGTDTIPPRPFLGPAGFRMAEPVAQDIGQRVVAAILGRG